MLFFGTLGQHVLKVNYPFNITFSISISYIVRQCKVICGKNYDGLYVKLVIDNGSCQFHFEGEFIIKIFMVPVNFKIYVALIYAKVLNCMKSLDEIHY